MPIRVDKIILIRAHDSRAGIHVYAFDRRIETGNRRQVDQGAPGSVQMLEITFKQLS